ncbi:MAG: dienelactone hydrolase family protein [Actinomycetota bacterium]
MRWTADPVTAKGVTQREFRVGEASGTLWTPEKGPGGDGAPLVLLGHGGGASRSVPVVVGTARRFVRHNGLAVAAIDAPLHGDRGTETFKTVPELMARMGSRETIQQAVSEWRATLDALLEVDGIIDRVGYWGLSMGTHLGVPVVAAEERIQTAVLGLFGAIGGGRQRAAAAGVTCPVMFLVQLDDEVVDPGGAIELFQLLGSKDKRLHAHPGLHSAVPLEEIEENGAFLKRHLTA